MSYSHLLDPNRKLDISYCPNPYPFPAVTPTLSQVLTAGDDAGNQDITNLKDLELNERINFTNIQDNIRIGKSSTGTLQGDRSLAIGAGAGRQGEDCIAIGINSGSGTLFAIQNDGCVAVGNYAQNENAQVNCTAVGIGSGMENQGSVGNIPGFSTCVGAFSGEISANAFSTCVGAFAGQTNAGEESVNIGANSGVSSAYGSVCVGVNSESQNDYGVAIGYSSVVAGDQGTSVGERTETSDFSTAVGSNAKATGFMSTSLGYNNISDGERCLTAGTANTIDNNNYESLAIGIQNYIISNIGLVSNNIAIGATNNLTDADGCNVIGASKIVRGVDNISIGYGGITDSGYEASISCGYNNILDSTTTPLLNDVVIGNNNNVQDINECLIIGNDNSTFANARAIILGNNILNTSSDTLKIGYSTSQKANMGQRSISIGNDNAPQFQDHESLSIGHNTNLVNAESRSITLGCETAPDIRVDAIVIGTRSCDNVGAVCNNNSIVLGSASCKDGVNLNSICCGYNSGNGGLNSSSIIVGSNSGNTGLPLATTLIGSNSSTLGTMQPNNILIGSNGFNGSLVSDNVLIGNVINTATQTFQSNNTIIGSNMANSGDIGNENLILGTNIATTGNNIGNNNVVLGSNYNSGMNNSNVIIGDMTNITGITTRDVIIGRHHNGTLTGNNNTLIGETGSGTFNNCLAIGHFANNSSVGDNSVAIQQNGNVILNLGNNCVCIGDNPTGANTIANHTITIGNGNNQSGNANTFNTVIGQNIGASNNDKAVGSNSVSIGRNLNNYHDNSADTTTENVCIGVSNMNTLIGGAVFCIGSGNLNSGSKNLSFGNSVVIGKNICQTHNTPNASIVALGVNTFRFADAGASGGNQVCIGNNTGNRPANNVLAIGTSCGNYLGAGGIALGNFAHFENLNNNNTSSTSSISIGNGASYSIPNGSSAVHTISIGTNANLTNQYPRVININASGATVNSNGADRCFMAPIRALAKAGIASGGLWYDPVTKEICYAP